jgi:hypothetical protein
MMHAFGVDDAERRQHPAYARLAARMMMLFQHSLSMPFPVWATSIEQKWVSFRERRRTMALLYGRSALNQPVESGPFSIESLPYLVLDRERPESGLRGAIFAAISREAHPIQ